MDDKADILLGSIDKFENLGIYVVGRHNRDRILSVAARSVFPKSLSQIRLASSDTVQTAKPITDDASLYMTIPVLDKCS